jgi:1-acyl-sn-glycerol-3-phosphate acyltransferase
LFDAYTRMDVEDLLVGFGLKDARWGRRIVEVLCRPPARRFAATILEYDRRVGRDGLRAAHWWRLNRLGRGLDTHGVAQVPREGPLLVVANHPGLNDSSALLASIPRHDLRVIGVEREFLRRLPHTSQYMFLLGATPRERIGLIRSTTRHLRAGGSLLVFPGGHIEPDPAVFPGAAEAVEEWSRSVDLWARHVPGLTIAPALVSHVLSPAAQRFPLVYMRRAEEDRRWLGAMLQLAIPAFQTTTVQLRFGRPILPGELSPDADGTPFGAVQREMLRLIAQVEGPATRR